ncbi:hypothetical protein PROFUN_09383 [Planoprotostelium fungivorum]|uniref:Uncharacterized protein n=1 Tax=Planoprotostelium fungivorum TaxID=1890364 RepID=A0A2P6NH02_9EUKA|nr:hypothetical protein PROFUN_09383 [Planoprotostelium fungivorum]
MFKLLSWLVKTTISEAQIPPERSFIDDCYWLSALCSVDSPAPVN